MPSLDSAVCKRFVFILSIAALFGCAGQASSLVPSATAQSTHPRTISHTYSANGQTYTIDEMYTPSGGNLSGVSRGPNDQMWFTADTGIGKSSPVDDMTEYALQPYGNATSIVEGPDRNLWVTLFPAAIGKVALDGSFRTYSIPKTLGGTYGTLYAIANGLNGDRWFLDGRSPTYYVVSVTTEGAMHGYKLPDGSVPWWLTADAKGTLWFTDQGTNAIVRMSAPGEFKKFTVPTPNAGVYGICTASNGTIWFVEQNANKIGSMTPSGQFHEYGIPTQYSRPSGIVAGPDGAMWFTESIGRIGRITPSGSVIDLPLSGPSANPFQITVGSDNNLWFSESQAYGILGRVDLHAVQGSQPQYSSFTLTLEKRPVLGVVGTVPLHIVVRDLRGKILSGRYPDPIHLTSSDSNNAKLSSDVLQSSDAKINIAYSGHYAQASIGANAAGGGRVYPATLVPSAPPEKRLPAPAFNVAIGADHSLWMCLSNGAIASRAEDGTVRTYPTSNYFSIEGCPMTEGSDGNVWFTDYADDRIGKITPQGKISYVQLEHDAGPLSIAAGSDGALWFTLGDGIGKVTTRGGVTEFNTKVRPYVIVSGPDGNLWFTDDDHNVFKLTTSGKMTRVRKNAAGGNLWSTAGGLWFAETKPPSDLVEMSTDGKIVKSYALPSQCAPSALTGTPGGTVWYVDDYDHCVVRLGTNGHFSVLPTHNQKENQWGFAGIVYGPNNDIWFTESGNAGLGWVDPSSW